MKLLITLDFPPEHGGIQSHLRGTVSHTFSKNDAVYVGCRQAPKTRAATRDFPCPVTYLSTMLSRWNKKWSLVPLLVHFLNLRRKQGKSLSVECGNVYAGIVPWLASVVAPVNYGVYAHGTELLGLRRPTPAGFVLKAVLKRASRIIANSAYTASLVRELRPAGRIDVAFPKIDYRPNSDLSSRIAPENTGAAVDILCVGRLVPHKGHDVLLEAVSRLPKETRWSLVIAGNGRLLGRLSMRRRLLGIGDRVRFKTGLSDPELEQEYRAASIFVLPTVPVHGTEGFGIVLLEAMAHRIPIIASTIGGVAEVLDNGSCGMLVAPGDPAQLCEAIVRVAGDGALRERLVSAAQERLLKRYVWP
jgi:glycosyltransferase involved in cell wall biosynthesis